MTPFLDSTKPYIQEMTPSSQKAGVLLPPESHNIHHYPYLDLSNHVYDNLICPLNLKPSHGNKRNTTCTFEELLTQNYPDKEPLSILIAARRALNENGILLVVDTSQTPNIRKYVEMLFCCAGFTLLNQQGNYFILRKRPLLTFFVPKTDNYIVKEAETLEEIERYFEFLKQRYHEDNNDSYSRDIDNLFTNQSTIFLAYPENNPSDVIGLARYTHFIPEYGYYLPFQLATFFDGKHQGQHIILDEKVKNAGESLALYNKSHGTKISKISYQVYQQLIWAIFVYKHDIAKTEISYTTYPKGNETIGGLYKDRFGFEDSLYEGEPVCLQYGTFADQWCLIESDRSTIEYQYRNPEQIFKKHKKPTLQTVA